MHTYTYATLHISAKLWYVFQMTRTAGALLILSIAAMSSGAALFHPGAGLLVLGLALFGLAYLMTRLPETRSSSSETFAGLIEVRDEVNDAA